EKERQRGGSSRREGGLNAAGGKRSRGGLALDSFGPSRQQSGEGDEQSAAARRSEAETILNEEGDGPRNHRSHEKPILSCRAPVSAPGGTAQTAEEGQHRGSADQTLRGQNVQQLVVGTGGSRIPFQACEFGRPLAAKRQAERVHAPSDNRPLAEQLPRGPPHVRTGAGVGQMADAFRQPSAQRGACQAGGDHCRAANDKKQGEG